LGQRPLGTVLHSSNEPGELSQRLCHDDSTINIVLDIIIIIIIIIIICYQFVHLSFFSSITIFMALMSIAAARKFIMGLCTHCWTWLIVVGIHHPIMSEELKMGNT